MVLCHFPVNLLPRGKILDRFKLNKFGDNKSNVAETSEFSIVRLENIVCTRKNAGQQHFLLFLLCFKKVYSSGLYCLVKGLFGKGLMRYTGHNGQINIRYS